jgi:DNA-binding winged helix-turn-helix (wHTH) protein/serine/threonine protein kinase/Tfp pilus assembly protein PilF
MLLLDRLPLGDSLPNPPLYVLTEFSRISEEIKSMVLNGSQTDVSEGSGRLWSFAGREFDESRLELRVNGKPVELELKPLDILVQLLLHAGEVVTKDELLDAVWPGLTVVEGSLSTAIYKLRKALGDEESTIVVTVPRVGYRLGTSVQSKAIRASPLAAELGLKADDAVPGREHWRLMRTLDVSADSEVWLARHPKTRELRVFKFASSAVRLKGLKREVTVSRFLRESLGERPELVRVLEWNFDTHPYFLESEYGGPNFAEWAESQGGLARIPLRVRLDLLADVARAVAFAHAAGVLHKDLKPANILVMPAANGGWLIKVADFGSASLVEPSRLKALGITNLGITQTGDSRAASLTGTLMYLAPEVLSGQSPTASADVYALGVMLYQLAIGDFHKAISPGWEAGIEDPLIREDIADAACGDSARRLASAAELAERLLALDRRRTERDQLEQKRKREQIAERRRADSRIRRPWIALAGIAALTLAVSLYLHRRSSSPSSSPRTVAVLPFQNVGSDRGVDFLSLALADEVATTLSYARGLSIRPFAATSKYTKPNLDMQRAGHEMKVDEIVMGHFLQEGDQLQLTLEAIDVSSDRLLWRDTLNVPAGGMIAMREQLVARTQGALAAALGASAFTTDFGTRPNNEEAYELYLRGASMQMDARLNRQAIAILEKSVGLDPNFAPAWLILSRRYDLEGRYGSGGNAMVKRYEAAAARALALDPNYIAAGANFTVTHIERGELAKAFQEAADLVRRRPDSPDAHHALGGVLRYAGLLQESASQCETTFLLDPHTRTSGLRSCAIVFFQRGDYQRAMDYIHLDAGSDFASAMSISILLRQGREQEALQIGPPHIPQWPSYDMLLACAQRRSSAEIATLAETVEPSDDPEANYLSAANLAYCGQTDAALQLLKRAIQGNYCSYPAIDSDPFFASVRAKPEFAEIRSAAIACQKAFLTERQRMQRPHQ